MRETYKQMAKRKKIIEALRGIMREEYLCEWMEKPNPSFGNRTPDRVMLDGDHDLIWQMIHGIDANVAN